MADPHFQVFARVLKEAIAAYPRVKETRLQTQRRQLETLMAMEDEWRRLLGRHRWGDGVYRDFVYHVCDQPVEEGGKRNILAARPYFRERQVAFTAAIADVLKERRHADLMTYRVNYEFIAWALTVRPWAPRSPIRVLAGRIEALRREIMVQNLPLAISRARIFWAKTPKSHLTFMDFVGIAAGGLLAGIDKFVPDLRPGMTEDEVLAEYRRFRSVVMGRMGGDFISNYCLDKDTILVSCNQGPKKLKDFLPGDVVEGVDECGRVIRTEVVALHHHGVLSGYEVEFDDGYCVTCSRDHKFLTEFGMVALWQIWSQRLGVYCEPRSSAEARGLGSPLWSDPGDQGAVGRACPDVSPVPGHAVRVQATETCDHEASSSGAIPGVDVRVWAGLSDQVLHGIPPALVCRLSAEPEPGQDEARGVDESVWAGVCSSEGAICPQQGLFQVSGPDSRGSRSECQGRGRDSEAPEGVAHPLWPAGADPASHGSPPQGLFSLPQAGPRDSSEQCASLGGVAPGQFRQGPGTHEGLPGSTEAIDGGSGLQSPCGGQDQCRGQGVETRGSGRLCGQDEESVGGAQALQGRGLAEVQWDLDVGRGADTVSGGQETGGLRERGPQDLGRSGREFSLCRGVEASPEAGQDPGQGRHVGPRGSEKGRCVPDPAGGSVLCGPDGANEVRLAPVAGGDAPLAAAGGLVLRHVVRVRAVGPRRMYDLEVAHAGHNFLLPNGVVTSNSETFLHFFPKDQRRLYRANKVMHYFAGSVDYEELAKLVNENLEPAQQTTPAEIADLLAAAGTVSMETQRGPDVADDEPQETQYEAPVDTRPDVRVEEAETSALLSRAIQGLSPFQRKVIRMKGVQA